MIVLYAVAGALLMNRWALTAASGASFSRTVSALEAAGQPYSAAPGLVFAGLGVVLAGGWCAMVLRARTALPAWAAVVSWAAILVCGAPAYFFTSFANMNAVGDTFVDWNADAAFRVEVPLYVTSGLALIVGLVTVLAVSARTVQRTR